MVHEIYYFHKVTKIDDLVLTAASFLPHFILFFPLPLLSIPAQTGVYRQQVLLEKVVLEESLHLLVSRQVWSLAILLNTCILAAAGSFTFCGCFETGLPHFPVVMFREIPFSQGHQMSRCFLSVTFPTDSWHYSGFTAASESVTIWSCFAIVGIMYHQDLLQMPRIDFCFYEGIWEIKSTQLFLSSSIQCTPGSEFFYLEHL